MSTEEQEKVIQEQPILAEQAPKEKVDNYKVLDWAVEPLKDLRQGKEQRKQSVKQVEFDKGRQQVLITLEQDENHPNELQIQLTIFENGILYFKAKNQSNTWDFQLDDVVGPLPLLNENIDNIELVDNGCHYHLQVLNANLNLKINKSPFQLSFSQNNHNFLEMNSLFCDGVVSSHTHLFSSNLYGIPEHPDHFNLVDTSNDKPYRLYNLDRYLWPIHSKGSLYGTAPILISHNENITTGYFWRNCTETYVDIQKLEQTSNVNWLSENGEFELVVFADQCIEKFYKKLADTIGYSVFPQLFALGYQHCRYSFKDQKDVDYVDTNFDELGIPYDVIYLDIDHCYKKRYFSFDKELYPDVDLMVRKLEGKGRKIVTIVDPHVLIDEEYYVYTESKGQQDFFIKNPDQTDFVGKCWPGDCNWLDFLNEDVRKYWASLYSYSKYKHSTSNFYTWNDMNEPAVFKGIEETMIKDNIHTVKNKVKNYQVPHTFGHNLYGLTQAMASFQGLAQREKENDQKRPLVLTRSWWVGSQKYAAIWTADSEAKWEYLTIHTPMLLTFSTVGFPYCGADVGGFEGNPPEDLHIRWYQVGAFQPFFRGHSSTFCDRREPWLYSKETCQNIRKAIRTRYEFLPVWYSEFFRHQRTGLPVMRALWQNYPSRTDLFNEEQVYMIGKDVLVAPIVRKEQTSVNLKGLEGRWYDYNNNYAITDTSKDIENIPLDIIPVFFRGGAIVLLYQILQNETTYRSSEDIRQKCPLQLIICLNEQQEAHGNFYMDDGQTFKYSKSGQFCVSNLSYKDKQLHLDVESKLQDQYWMTEVNQVVLCGLNNLNELQLSENMTIEGDTLKITGLSINLNKSNSFHLF
ncbi:glycoside hydrolase family 31 protein (macronuclear) [Tetrahymena thermophila SB210]|uniref:Glucosidase II subunit alpha n=1 Tax=Tetrahymena thermophila (strain SB210) TaxID=312017 RepID=I7MAK1_TETTS|nr:glycoside hydrolase family 31 protein [Tetrahymena thermophila SB210]EAS04747.2 glycoside hydrolase family 31 protein [Tetrahymena thermophila SB210]|eukprot:XP_001024992.2 glycoside hydrolase family 31 protein [Tetrahymena thermophila SB210]